MVVTSGGAGAYDVRREIIETVRAFVAREVVPVASELERADAFPSGIVDTMRTMGLFGVTIPERYGGLELDLVTYVGIIEELAYGWMSLTGIVNTHTMVASLLMAHGREEQKERWLPMMASGERRGALSLSEPDAGTDTRNISCQAVRDGDEYVVNGTKAWVTNGERAGIVALAARTEEGISALIVEKEPGPSFEGISVSKHVGQARLSRRGNGGHGLRRPPCACGQSGRRGRPGLAADPRRPRGGAHQHRGACLRRGARRVRRRTRLRQAAHHLRQAHR
jgi:alkylation response protein AidB-like acyl-CoA dehydrogenase